MTVPSFLIKNGGTDFMNRQKNLFDVLSDIDKSRSSPKPNDEFMELDDKGTRRNKRKRTKKFLGKESLFKIPSEPPPRFVKPRHNPYRGKRWIKYSLADVSDYDLSNEGNKAAALSFLQSIKERKAKEVAEENQVDSTKHFFKSTSNVSKCDEGEEAKEKKSVFRSSKLIMPEYVVGQDKKTRKAVHRSTSTEKTKEVYLDHIHFQDEE